MAKYQELFFEIVKIEESDVITASAIDDNIGGANGNWNGWSEEA